MHCTLDDPLIAQGAEADERQAQRRSRDAPFRKHFDQDIELTVCVGDDEERRFERVDMTSGSISAGGRSMTRNAGTSATAGTSTVTSA